MWTRRTAHLRGRGRIGQQCLQRDRIAGLQPAVLFHFGQRQQLVDGLGQPFLLIDNAAREMHAVRFGQRLLQQFGGTADRRQRALHLVRQRLHVLLDVGLAFELAAHRFLAEIADLVATAPWWWHRFARADRACISAELAEASGQPHRHQHADQRRQSDEPGTALDDGSLAGSDERINLRGGLGG